MIATINIEGMRLRHFKLATVTRHHLEAKINATHLTFHDFTELKKDWEKSLC